MFDEEFWMYARGELKIPFSYKEGALLMLFMKNRGKIITYDEICFKIIGCPQNEDTKEDVRKKISSLVNRIRKKIANDGEIETLPWKGYRLN